MTTALITIAPGTLPNTPDAIRARIRVLSDELRANEEEKQMMEEEIEHLERKLEELE